MVSSAYMEIDPRRMRVLLAVVRAHGVVGASKALHLTPQAVSQQIAALEGEAGVPLFDRSRRRLQPTEVGRLLAAHAERIESELVAARRTVAAATGRASGTVRIAAFQSAIRWLVVEALPVLRSEQPSIVPMVVELFGRRAESALRAGHVDLVIEERDESEPEARPASLTSTLLGRDPYRVVAADRVADALRTPRSLAGEPWIAAPDGASARVALDRLASRWGFAPKIAHVCLEFPSVLALVTAGEGIALVPELALADARGVTVCPVGRLGVRRLVAVQRSSSRGTEPAVEAVTRALRRTSTQGG